MTAKSKIATKLMLIAILIITASVVAFFLRSAPQGETTVFATTPTVPEIEEETVMYCELSGALKEVTNLDLLSYSPRFSSLNARIYYSHLEKNEQLIYSAYEYAFESSCTVFYLNQGLFNETGFNDVELLILLSLDHPLVDQNFEITTSPASKDISGFKKDKYLRYEIPAFSQELYEKKLQALGAAQAVVSSLPKSLSQSETALELYSRLCNFCEYELYGTTVEPICYVYDALVKGVSHCDGFSNAYSLLLNLAGIRCVEKARYDEPAQKTSLEIIGDTSESGHEYYKTPTGHTWAVFEIDGKWYDADPSYDSKDRLLSRNVENLFLAFGLPSGFSTDYSVFDYAALAPICADSFLIEPDCEFKTVDDENAARLLYAALQSTSRGYVYLTFESAEMEDLRRLAENVCNYADISVYYGRCKSTPVLVYFSLREKN